MSCRMFLSATCASAALLLGTSAQAQTVLTNADGIVRNSLCVGFDCQLAITFSDSTLILKENNTRIKFADTSLAPFPTNDWEIEANSASTGIPGYLGFNDCGTAADDGGCQDRLVFAVEAGARVNALFVSSASKVGLGTSAPVLDLHAVNGNTPGIRLEQNGSFGFSSQTWDIAGNETNFFVRDVTSGSRLPLRIFPGAPTNAVSIAASGDVGMGTNSPTAPLNVNRTNGTGALHIKDTGGSGPLQMLKLENDGAVQLFMNNTTNASAQWLFSAGSNLLLSPTAVPANAVFDLSNTGNLTIQGALTQSSDKNAKMAIEPVDADAILAKVAALPVSSWTYKHDADSGIRHIGPMAQDFYAAFGTGETDTGISSLDTTGVALAAIQAQQALIERLSARNDHLSALIEPLSARIKVLEGRTAAD